ncbi:plastocyanin/azurin family copper-binding protein [Halobacterium zhouii]|uniref:plastocyanin/azurin family copper-binding protein n=1 Tax=Halobacterium zhouii TaxID=2902624 RepID=UPI001E3A7825|nr:plastocyanin/azurin family copper-binding protein [Halobacterium zhouii]
MERRAFLKKGSLVATAGLVGIAGCGNPEGDGGGGTTTGAGETQTTTAGTTQATQTTQATETTQAGTTEGAQTTQGETTQGNQTTQGGTTNETAGGTQTGTAGGGAGATNTVQMVTEGGNYYFNPIGLYVEPGETITWVIDSGSHSSTAYAKGTGGASVRRIPQDAEPWDSGILSEQGASFDHTFEVPGTYDYFCIPHKSLGMIGRLVVGEPGGPAEGTQPPDGQVPESQRIVEQGAISYSEFHE